MKQVARIQKADSKKIATVLKSQKESDAVYKKQFALFVGSTNQKQKQSEQLLAIVSGMRQKRRFLDVGAGSGEITASVAREFESTTLIEPNPEQIKALSTRFPEWRILQETLESVDLGDEDFDLILCSHVLYYIPEPLWMKMVEKMDAHLTAGGKLVIVLQSPEGEAPRFFRKFTGHSVNAVGLWGKLVRAYGEARVKTHYGIASIKTTTIEDMTAIGLFLLLDKKFRSRAREISRYFEAHHKTAGGYRLDQEYITFEIAKHANKPFFATP